MKKVLSLILMLAICAGSCAGAKADVAEVEKALYFGDYAYTLVDGLATIVGCNGAGSQDWNDEESGIPDRSGLKDESARFPQSVDADGVWRIVVPATLDGHPVVAIGCDGLNGGVWGDIVLPEGLTSIGPCAFYACTESDAITVPASVTSISKGAFDYCSATLRVTEGSYAARYAEENGIPYTYDMEYMVLQSENWQYALTGGVATILKYDCSGYDEADGNAALDLVIPDHLNGYPVVSVRSLSSPYATFEDPDSAPNPVSATIPAGVTEITGNPFTESTGSIYVRRKLARIAVSPDNPFYEAVDGVLFDMQRNILVAYPTARTGAYTIPEGVAAIGDSAFENSSDLTSVIIPTSVTSIGSCAFSECSNLTDITIPDSVTSIGEYAFYWCESLTNVTLPASLTSIGMEAFNGCLGLTSVTIPTSVTSIGDGAFSQCEGLASVIIPEGVTSIGDDTFYECKGLTSVTIPEGVTNIGVRAFSGCKGLTSITIPESVTSIGECAFIECGFTSVAIPEGVTSIDYRVFSDCKNLMSVTIPEGMASIGDFAFSSSGLTSVAIPASVTSIGDGAFSECDRLTSVTIPESVTSIGDRAFYECKNLISLTISEGVKRIGDEAFSMCESLTSVTIPASVTNIEANPFCGCTLLYIEVASDNPVYEAIDGILFAEQRSILVAYPSARAGAYAIPEGIVSIGKKAFRKCEGFTSVTIPESVVIIGGGAFSLSGLTNVTIPASVASIGDSAFNGCDRLTSVTISEGVTSIGDYAFYRCGRLTGVTIPASVTSIGFLAFGGGGYFRMPPPLTVIEGSYAEQYAKENDHPYVLATE